MKFYVQLTKEAIWLFGSALQQANKYERSE